MSNKVLVNLLKTARDFIKTPDTWCQKFLFAGKDGMPCYSYEAVKFCSLGALDKAASASNAYTLVKAAEDALQTTVKELSPGKEIAVYNDTHNHAEVLSMWDQTISRLEKEVA